MARIRPTASVIASIARSTSPSVVVCPKLRRNAPMVSSALSPIAAKTCEGSIAPLAQAEAAEAQRRESRAKRAAEGREGGLPPRRPASKAPPRRSGIRFPNYEEDRNRRPPVTPEGRSGPQDWSPDKTPAKDREAGEGSGRSPATPRGSPREGRSAPREPGRAARGDAGRTPRGKGPDPRPGGKSRQ